MEKIWELLLRFVIAVETIAGSTGNVVTHTCEKAKGAASLGLDTGAPREETQDKVEFKFLEHAVLKKMCLEKGIDVPPRTQKATLIKWLEEKADPGPDPTGFNPGLNTSTSDPLETDPLGTGTEEKVTAETVKAALIELRGSYAEDDPKCPLGTEAVGNMLKRFGKVVFLKELAEADYAKVHAGTLEALKHA